MCNAFHHQHPQTINLIGYVPRNHAQALNDMAAKPQPPLIEKSAESEWSANNVTESTLQEPPAFQDLQGALRAHAWDRFCESAQKVAGAKPTVFDYAILFLIPSERSIKRHLGGEPLTKLRYVWQQSRVMKRHRA
jgi:hypothetical protein